MPLPSLHPLPNNPTTGQAPVAAGLRGGPPPASAAGGGGVARETLKGLQDVYWSDEEDDPDCLLCAEPLDLSDLSFKPCQCGMQICQFCYNKLLQTDSRCPGCRRPYDAKAVVYQPVDVEEMKRQRDKKAKRAKTIKQLSSLGRAHLLGVRVVMKNMVYVIGMKIPGTGDEAISILRSNDYFGQYGKISKLYLRERQPSLDALSAPTGIYIVYVRREDAARAILALDGIPAPQGGPGQILRAGFGTTRYCDSFLRGQKCDNPGCTHLHEWGGDSDCFTKDDFETALTRPAEYDARQKQAQVAAPSLAKPSDWPKPSSVQDPIGSSALPTAAAWGKGVTVGRSNSGSRPTAAPIGTSRPSKPPTSVQTALPLKSNAAFPLPTPSPVQAPPVKEKKEKKERPTSMARGKSTDSSMSLSTPNSAHTSPKRKPSALAPVTTTKAPPPPPGLSIASASTSAGASQPSASAPAMPPTPDETSDELQSGESEAGPSSASPAPQTPSRLPEHPQFPVTDEPIFIHSPFEEPLLFSFPSSDPGFAFVLGLDNEEIQRLAEAAAYQPSPFSKTLVGLAELGVLAPELPNLVGTPPVEVFNSSFQPFEPLSQDSTSSRDGSHEPAEVPEEEEEEWERDAPRTTSKFDFARPSSRSTSIGRGQSPFALTRTSDDREWRQASSGSHLAQQVGQGEGGALGLAHHSGLMGFPSGGSGTSNEWAGIGEGSPYANRTDRYKRDREEYDQANMLNYQPSVSSRLFSPDAPSHNNLDDFHSHTHPHSHSHSPVHATPGNSGHTAPPPGFMHAHAHGHNSPHYDVRNMGYGARPPQSPSPLPQGFRRY